MRAISKEIRNTIIKHKKNGEKTADISKWLDVTKRVIDKIWLNYKTIGNVENNYKNCGRKSSVPQDKMEQVKAKIKEQPDITLQELIDLFDLNISVSGLCKKLKKLGYTLKKRLLLQENN